MYAKHITGTVKTEGKKNERMFYIFFPTYLDISIALFSAVSIKENLYTNQKQFASHFLILSSLSSAALALLNITSIYWGHDAPHVTLQCTEILTPNISSRITVRSPLNFSLIRSTTAPICKTKLSTNDPQLTVPKKYQQLNVKLIDLQLW